MSDKKNKKEETDSSESVEVKTCFVIMPLAKNVDGYSPGHFTRVFEHIIKPACEKAGFIPKRANDVKSANFILADILKSIVSDDMVICDLSSKNPNVMYELAIRQCFDLPVTLLKDDITIEPFDIYGIRYVDYDKELRIDLVSEAVDKLAMAIVDTYSKKDKDFFSLVHILGRDKADIKKDTLTADTLAILDAFKSYTSRPSSVIDTSFQYGIRMYKSENFDQEIFTNALYSTFSIFSDIEYYYSNTPSNIIVTIRFKMHERLSIEYFENLMRGLTPNLIAVEVGH